MVIITVVPSNKIAANEKGKNKSRLVVAHHSGVVAAFASNDILHSKIYCTERIESVEILQSKFER